MERIKVTVVCDRCEQDTELKPGAGIEIKFGSVGAVVDLCPSCHQQLLELIEPVIDRGRSTTTARKQRAERKPLQRVACPECGKLYYEGAGLTIHRRTSHKITGAVEEEHHEYAEATG